jgi:hypothetical protein
MNTRDFANRHNIGAYVLRINKRPDIDMDAWEKTARHWLVVLHRVVDGSPGSPIHAEAHTYYSQGPAHRKPPSAADVLDSLASDIASVRSARDFEDWCSDMGVDPDSRKWFACYERIFETQKSLLRLLGSSLLDELVEKTERL